VVFRPKAGRWSRQQCWVRYRGDGWYSNDGGFLYEQEYNEIKTARARLIYVNQAHGFEKSRVEYHRGAAEGNAHRM
jgi:hypothetical protein